MVSADCTVLRRWAMRTEVRPVIMRVRARRTRCSVSVSTELVASSRTRMAGAWARARAKEMSCFWPVERVAPRSRTGSSKPAGRVRMKSAMLTSSAAFSRASLVIQLEEEWVLEDDSEAAAEGGEVLVSDVDAVDEDLAVLDVVEAHHQGDDGGLAGSGVADDGGGFSGGDGEGDAAEDPFDVGVGNEVAGCRLLVAG
jgi:hypothetical protein